MTRDDHEQRENPAVDQREQQGEFVGDQTGHDGTPIVQIETISAPGMNRRTNGIRRTMWPVVSPG
ncbi:hypothetical protein GCM10027444_27670 [Actinopolyspora lacussalsi]